MSLAIAFLLAVSSNQMGGTGLGPDVSDFVVTDKSAYLVLPPQAVGGPQTIYADWSPSGRYLLLGDAKPILNPSSLNLLLQGNRPPAPTSTLTVWDRQLGKSTELGTVRGYVATRGITSGPRWMGKSEVAIDLFTELLSEPSDPGPPIERVSLVRLDAASGRLQLITIADSVAEGVFYTLHVSYLSARALVIETLHRPRDPQAGISQPVTASAMWSIDSSGRRGKRSPALNGSISGVRWTADPRRIAVNVSRLEEGKRVVEWHVFNLESASLTATPQPPPHGENVEPVQELETKLLPSQTSAGTAVRSHRAAWLRSLTPSSQSEFLLAARADNAILNVTNDAVAVLDQGVVTVRQLAKVPLALYLSAKEAAEKAQAMSNAKQVATALHMFAADNEDRFPSPEEFGQIDAYIKNSSVSKGFVYTFKGGSFGSIASPAETVIGYLPGPGGFAIAYADGHVVWGKKPPKG